MWTSTPSPSFKFHSGGYSVLSQSGHSVTARVAVPVATPADVLGTPARHAPDHRVAPVPLDLVAAVVAAAAQIALNTVQRLISSMHACTHARMHAVLSSVNRPRNISAFLTLAVPPVQLYLVQVVQSTSYF